MIIGPKIITDGLVFGYDADDRSSRFYRGEPTTNFVYRENPRIDSSYAPVDLSSYGGTMVANHPGIIKGYKIDGSALTAIYYNSGVSDPTNQHHAYWVYDDVLKKPVVQMIDTNHSWQAKSYSTGTNAWSTYGLTTGSQYTISWLQWVTDITKHAVSGVYCRNSSGTWSFHDGQSYNASSYNTKTYTWEKMYQTYTVSTNHDLTLGGESIYMYGMYGNLSTIRISDVQFEFKSHPTQFCNKLTRTSTESLYNLKDKSVIDISNVSFDSTAHPIFDGNDDYITVPSIVNQYIKGGYNPFSINFWVYSNESGTRDVYFGDYSTTGTINFNIERNTTNTLRFYWNGSPDYSFSSFLIPQNTWVNICITYNGTTLLLYKNGQLNYTQTVTLTNVNKTSGNFLIGRDGRTGTTAFNGKLPLFYFYNKTLTPLEVEQNYITHKKKFNF